MSFDEDFLHITINTQFDLETPIIILPLWGTL